MWGSRVGAWGFAMLIVLASPVCDADYSLTPYLGDSFRSGAGRSAAADDAATVFNNPAGISRLDGPRLTVDAQLYLPSSTFSNAGSTDTTGAAITGNDGGDAGNDTFIPGLYYSRRLDERWSWGVSVNVPFGLSSHWNRNWVGRYQNIKTGIKTLNISPAATYRIDDAWSVGVGLDAQYAKADLSNAIDFGVVCLSQASPSTCSSLGMGAPQSADGLVELEGDDWGYGYNLGVLYSHGKLRLGATYRSKISYTLTGNANFTNPPQAAAFSPAFTDTKASVPLTLPEVASFGVYYQSTPRLAIMGNATWTRWSRMDKLTVHFQNPAQPDQSYARNWRDTWRWSLGFDYRLDPKWRLQWGGAYAPSAIPDSTYDASVPTSDAYWLSAGAQYAYSPTFGFGFGLTHIFFQNRDVNHTGAFGDTLRGTVHSTLDIVGAQLHWRM